MTTTTSTLPQSLQKAMHEILDRTNIAGGYVRAVLLSTTEGVPLGRCISSIDIENNFNTNNIINSNNSANSSIDSNTSATALNDNVLSSIESIWSPSSKQFPMLGLGKLKQSTIIYDHGTIVQVYETPLVITILCGPQSNIGAVRSTTVPLLKQVLEPLAKELIKMLQVGDVTIAPATATGTNINNMPGYYQ